jgi:hypothetical protein
MMVVAESSAKTGKCLMLRSRRSFTGTTEDDEGPTERTTKATRMGGLGSAIWKINYELLCDNLNGGTAQMDLVRFISDLTTG